MSDYLDPTLTPMSIEPQEITPEVLAFFDNYLAQQLKENMYRVFELWQDQYATFDQRVEFFRNLWFQEGPPELFLRLQGPPHMLPDNTVGPTPPQPRWEPSAPSALALAIKLEPEAAREAGRQAFEQAGMPFPDYIHFPESTLTKQPVFNNTTQWDAPVQPPITAGEFDWLSPPDDSFFGFDMSLPLMIPEEPEAEAKAEAEALTPPESVSTSTDEWPGCTSAPQTPDEVLFGPDPDAFQAPPTPAPSDKTEPVEEPVEVTPTIATPFTPTRVVLGNGATSSHPRRSTRLAQGKSKPMGRSYSLA